MEIVLFLIIVVLFIVIYSAIGNIERNQHSVLTSLQHLQSELVDAKKAIKDLGKNQIAEAAKTQVIEIEKEAVIQPKQPIPIPEHKIIEVEFDIPIQVEESKVSEPVINHHLFINSEPELKENNNYFKETEQQESLVETKSWKKQFQSGADIEKFIGENLINKIGIAVLVLGIAFFIKYAIDKNWIGEYGRVAIGLFCGTTLIGIAHYLRNNYRSFSSVLVGGGLTVLYFSIGFAFQQYQMFSQTLAFIMVCLVTVLALFLCIFYNRIELAIIATIGGFITPFIVSTGSGNYKVLFSYLAVLNIGLIILAFLKQWRVVQYIAFVFTTIIFSSWMYNRISLSSLPITSCIAFATLFYLLFLAMNLLHHLVKKYTLKPIDFSLYLAVNLAYFVCVISALDQSKGIDFKGLFTTLLALANGLLLWWIYTKKEIDKNFQFLQMGITVSYFSLIAPIQFEGQVMILFWCAEMVVLFWLYQKTTFELIKISSLIIAFVTIISLLTHLFDYDSFDKTELIIINKQFVTYLFAAICFYVFSKLLYKEANMFFLWGVRTHTIRRIIYVISLCLFFISGYNEVNYQFSERFININVEYVFLLLYVVLFAIVILKTHTNTSIKQTAISVISLFLFKLGIWMFLYGALVETIISNNLKWQLIVFLFAECGYYYYLFCAVQKTFKQIAIAGETLFTLLFTLINLFSISLSMIVVYLAIVLPDTDSLDRFENIYNRAGLSIIWGMISFVAMWLGMKFSNKALRIFSLVLFAITLIKLAVIDIQKMNEGGKIIAFIILGAILLIVSFMYQKLKKIVSDK